jgi:L-fuculose-phosphate aldolase
MIFENKLRRLKNEIMEIGKQSVQMALVTTIGGNISVKLDDHHFLITESGKALSDLTYKNILKIDSNGNNLKGDSKPSKEAKMHLSIYKQRTDVNAVVHLHPIIATTLISIDEVITAVTMEELFFMGEKIGVVPLLPAGSNELMESVMNSMKECNVVVLKNHGATSAGASLEEAFYRIIKLERAAQATLIAKTFGKGIGPFKVL